jgi:hypothetical protein
VLQAVAAHGRRQLGALPAGDLYDGLADDRQHSLAVDLGAQRVDQRGEQARFDLTPPEHPDLVQSVGWRRV